MSTKKPTLPPDLQRWVEARGRYHLSHAVVQMARELGMNPRKLGKLANHRQEPWKLPLPEFIIQCFRKSFGRDQPERVRSVEEIWKEKKRKQAARKERKRLLREARAEGDSSGLESNAEVPF
jgi:hypothetical protein